MVVVDDDWWWRDGGCFVGRPILTTNKHRMRLPNGQWCDKQTIIGLDSASRVSPPSKQLIPINECYCTLPVEYNYRIKPTKLTSNQSRIPISFFLIFSGDNLFIVDEYASSANSTKHRVWQNTLVEIALPTYAKMQWSSRLDAINWRLFCISTDQFWTKSFYLDRIFFFFKVSPISPWVYLALSTHYYLFTVDQTNSRRLICKNVCNI